MKLLVVDDHPSLRAGLKLLLSQAEAGTVVLEAAGGPEGLRLAQEHPDLDAAFVDLVMPGMHGMMALQEFVREHPRLPVVVLSSSEDPHDVRRAMALGAFGYLPKSASPETILSALRLVLSGNIYVPPLLLQSMPVSGAAGTANAGLRTSYDFHLTERQLVVLKLLCVGLSNKEICCRLGLSEKTVKAHVSGIFKAMNVVNRTQAALAARQAGLVSVESDRPE
ncbi:MAG TPA: response regulator transcription factor [Candidatus Angelobacter sp.]|nr:response regulator transcription factor [Candidatus Angelobacter sp.]